MKNAMKKLLSLALVAMLLVSVVPMGAMAAEDDLAVFDDAVPFADTEPSKDVPVQVYINDERKDDKILTIKGWNPVTLDASLAQTLVSSWTNRTFVKWTNNSGEDVTGGTLRNDEWLHNQSDYSLNLYLKQVDPAPNSKSVTVYVMENNKQVDTKSIRVAGGGVTLDANLLPISGYKFVKWAVDGNKDVTGNSYVVGDCPNALFLYVEKDGSGSGNSGNTLYKYTVYVYDWNGNLIKDGTTYNATPYQNVTVQADNFYSMKVNGVQLGQGVNYFTLNQNETRVDVTTTTNSGNNPGNNPGIPGQNTFNVYFKGADKTSTVYTYTVTRGNSIGYTAVQTARNAVGDKTGYDFAGWQLDGAGSTLSTETVAATCPTRDVTYYPVFTPKSSKFVNDIYLNIFVNGKADVPAKSIKLNDYTIISDDVINLDEVLTVVDDYYKASNTNKGLQLDGLYVAKGNFVSNWATDSGKSSSISGLKSMRYDSVVGINVMVTNAVVKSSSNADTSNPKTGDDIYMTVTVMGLSAAALCAVYYISKKRAVR